MPILRVRDENGEIQEILALRGKKGDKGDLASVFLADDGNGNVTIGTKSAGMDVVLIDDGEGNIRTEVV